MALFAKKYFHWKEPEEFVQRRDAADLAERQWWFQPLMVLVTVTMLLVSWYLARLNPNKHPPPFHMALPVDFAIAVIMVYVTPWIIALCPSYVGLHEDWLVRTRGNSNQKLKYANIEYFAWRKTEVMTTLVLTRRKSKREMLLGVPLEISKDDVQLFLLSRDVMPQPGA